MNTKNSPLGRTAARIRTRGLAAWFVSLSAVLLLVPTPSPAQIAAPGDVYFSADVWQRFKYYAFANDYVQWADETIAGASLQYSSAHDTSTVHGAVSISTDVDAFAGTFECALRSEMTLEARTGIYHDTFNDITPSLYLIGPTGTPYTLTTAISGTLEASRVGGAPGSLQPVNGTSVAEFEDESLWISDGGVFSAPLEDFTIHSGTTTTEILVDGITYSKVQTRVFTSYGSVTQAICILGCMTEAADFHSLVDARITMTVYPGAGPTGAPFAAASPGTSLRLAASPNPARGAAHISFTAPAHTPTTVDLLDVSGRRVARVFDALASGGAQSVHWNAAGLRPGVYFLRAESAGVASTTKLTLVR